MLWVFAALACNSNDGDPPVESGDDTATVGDDTATNGADVDGDGYIASVDCDDSERDVHPGAEETCGNGRDDNCNGTADGCDWSGELALEGTDLSTGDVYSTLGLTLAVCDANGDGVDDIVAGAPFYDSSIGAVYVFYGPIRDDRDVKDADHALMGTEKDVRIGFSVDCRRDFDGDGLPDIVVGAPGGVAGATRIPGSVYLVPGGGTGTLPIADEASSTWIGSDAEDGLGQDVVAIDADGDDTDELAVAPWPIDDGPHRFGVAYLFEDAGSGESDADAAAAAYLYGEEQDRIEGTLGNAGDLDGDGLEELAITGTDEVSAQLLVFGAPLVGPIPKSDADVWIVGGSFGNVLSGIGHADLDADGRDDLIVANRSDNDGEGAVYAFLWPIAHSTNTSAAELRFLGSPQRHDVGSDVTSPGDIDGDGIPDLLIGASSSGVVFLQYGGESGVYDLEKDAQAWWQDRIEEEFTLSAGAALAAGDVTGDGIVDFVIGSPYYGASYAAYGRVTIVPSWQL